MAGFVTVLPIILKRAHDEVCIAFSFFFLLASSTTPHIYCFIAVTHRYRDTHKNLPHVLERVKKKKKNRRPAASENVVQVCETNKPLVGGWLPF